MRNEKGFTLIEMMIVLLIISVLLIITVPNVAKHQQTIEGKGCEAFIRLVQGQIQAYKLDTDEEPANYGVLVEEEYLPQPAPACEEEVSRIFNESGEANGGT
ncbi:MAG TPA: competence type IV pilus major pilin ComGC [Bacillus sp. (in: firmicutes)]|uniref:competence type IV pilus major pilin ComGC n=1 Tax=Bacillus litorisediminis TaxID=2922713 RepID=UPI001FAFA524|nr:competence type IV pilus major pilin ComGC [Bacillus litorisediminis]HWO77622.1 competence type IV pilus major pilin ComGC [Bacillus sp. (in: firmicutes)]